MWTDLDLRIAKWRLDQIINEERFRLKLLPFQVELEWFKVKIQMWAATHREEGGDIDGNQDHAGLQTDNQTCTGTKGKA